MNQRILSDFIKNNSRITCVSNRKLVYGIGVNDSDYLTTETIDNKKVVCPYYLAWKSMLMRCYCEKFKLKQPAYIGCSVCKDWQIFSNFRAWMEVQDWESKELDKDIINPGNKVYCEENCVFVTREINALLNRKKASRGAYEQGVSFNERDKNFKSVIKINGSERFLGYFSTEKKASIAYNKEKSSHIANVANEQENKIIKDGLLRHADIYLNKAMEIK